MIGVTTPSILIISNKYDFSTDLVANQLRIQNHSFLRLNRDQFNEYNVNFEPTNPSLTVIVDSHEFHFTERTLKSIYFRAPTFLRENASTQLDEEEQLYNSQWAAFIRALLVFENVKWVNNPANTYRAEIKALQLKYAKAEGLFVPETIITNQTNMQLGKLYAIKSIDSAIVNIGNKEAFVYTNIVKSEDLPDYTYSSPFFLQEALVPKIDIRVTVIEETIIAVKILGEKAIDKDWRKYKDRITYQEFVLPKEIKDACLRFARKFNLQFAAIDLILSRDKYYFIEVNPTGEWAWLQKNTGIRFDHHIVTTLTREELA